MDKQGIIGVIGLLLLAFLWMQFSPTLQPQPLTVEESRSTQENTNKTTILSTTQKQKLKVNKISKIKSQEIITDLEVIYFGNDYFKLTIDPEKGVLDGEFTQYKASNKKDNFSFFDKKNGSLAIYDPQQEWQFGQAKIKHNGGTGKLATKVTVSRVVMNKNFTLVQEWQLKKDTLYQYDYNISFISLAEEVKLTNLRLQCGYVAPMSDANSYMSFADQSIDIAIKDKENLKVETIIFSSSKDDLIERDQTQGLPPGTSKEKISSDNTIKWVAIKNQYFANIVDSKKGFTNSYMGYANLENDNTDNKLISLESSLAPIILTSVGETKTLFFQCYTGPQQLNLLESLGDNKKSILQFSLFFKWKFAWLGFIAEFLLKALNFFNGIFGSYGVAIIALTISIKAVFWRLTQKSNKSMKKMQELGPEMKVLREKFKDNPQVMQQKTMELYRLHGVNPISGCLPIFLQMPIYIALFSMIRSALELRHQNFLWATDLAQPDTLFSVFGFDFRLLVLIWIGLMIYQQRSMPNNAEPLQRNMMMIMPVIMLIFCYGAPSALTLYFAVQGLVSLIQYKINNNQSKRIKKIKN